MFWLNFSFWKEDKLLKLFERHHPVLVFFFWWVHYFPHSFQFATLTTISHSLVTKETEDLTVLSHDLTAWIHQTASEEWWCHSSWSCPNEKHHRQGSYDSYRQVIQIIIIIIIIIIITNNSRAPFLTRAHSALQWVTFTIQDTGHTDTDHTDTGHTDTVHTGWLID